MSVSTLKYCVYEEMLNTPCQLLVGGDPPPSAKCQMSHRIGGYLGLKSQDQNFNSSRDVI